MKIVSISQSMISLYIGTLFQVYTREGYVRNNSQKYEKNKNSKSKRKTKDKF